MSDSRRFSLLVLCLFLIVGFAAYASVANAFFLSDDFALIGKVLEGDRSVTWGREHGGFFRPLFIFSYFLDAHIWGRQPFGFHLTNIALHIACSFLVFLTALSLTRDSKLARTPSKAISFTAGLIFLVHPAHTEAVSWISGRVDLLATAFGLGALLCLMRFFRGYRRGQFIAALVLFVLALLAKESALCLPLAAFLVALYFNKSSGLRFALKRAALYSLPFAIILTLYICARAYVLGTFVGGYGADQHLKFSHGIILSQLLRFFLRAIFPAYFLQSFTFLESRRVSPTLIAGAVVILLIAVIAMRRSSARRALIEQIRRHDSLWLILALGLCCLLPVINLRINLFDTQGERYMYLASAFFSIAIAYLLLSVSRYNVRLWVVLIGLLLLVYVVALHKTNQTWKEAAQLSKSILTGMVRQSNHDKVLLLNAPDNLRGAYVFRNGLNQAAESFQNEKQIIDARAIAFHRLDTYVDEIEVREESGAFALRLAYPRDFEKVDVTQPCVTIVEQSQGFLRLRLEECGEVFDVFVLSSGEVKKIAETR